MCKFYHFIFNIIHLPTAGECTSTKRNRLTSEYLETEVLINQNKHY